MLKSLLKAKLTSEQHRRHHSGRRFNGRSHLEKVQAVDGAFEEEGHANVEHFGTAEETQRDDDSVEDES